MAIATIDDDAGDHERMDDMTEGRGHGAASASSCIYAANILPFPESTAIELVARYPTKPSSDRNRQPLTGINATIGRLG
jgi:hypothetical protein